MRGRSVLASLGIAVIIVVGLAACSEDAEETPSGPVGGQEATQQEQEATAPAYPMTVTDMLGRSVEIPESPTRIVSISPTATEMLYRVGGAAVARDTASRHPPEAQGLPTVGGAYTPSVEAIVAQEPDLILIEGLTQRQFLDPLAQAGAPVVAVQATSLADVTQGLELLGEITGKQEAAQESIQDIDSRIEAASSKVSVSKSVLILISDADRNIYAAKPESYAGAVATTLKLKNLAEGLPDSGPFPGFTTYTGEQAATANPDFIFTISPAPEPAPRLSSVLVRVPGYAELAAVEEGRLKEIDPALFLQAPGPRIAEAAEELAGLLEGPS